MTRCPHRSTAAAESAYFDRKNTVHESSTRTLDITSLTGSSSHEELNRPGTF